MKPSEREWTVLNVLWAKGGAALGELVAAFLKEETLPVEERERLRKQFRPPGPDLAA